MDLSVARSTQHRLQRFNDIRGKVCEAGSFWDVVVLTAVDDAQKHSYEVQLKRKLQFEQLPLSAAYVVVADPPGAKIGNGGSTFEVINHLFESYKDDVWQKKIIIIHAGGFSQRLPNASLLGKAFMAMPIGDPMYQALELKLATYIDFPRKIHDGGIFVCCADSIEVYNDDNIQWNFASQGFTALAHMSPVAIGRTHGVFILDSACEGTGIVRSCRSFLHKPSVEKMVSTEDCVVLENTQGKWVMTDSAFFISASQAKSLHRFYQQNKPITCEIDAYGDFLQALGRESSPGYVANVENVCRETGDLVELRMKVYELLKDSPLHAVVLASLPHTITGSKTSAVNSIFYHIGTFPEYLHHLTADNEFKTILGVDSLTSCAGTPQNFNTNEKGKNSTVQISKLGALSCSIKQLNFATPCIMGSVLHADVTIGEGSIVEYCLLRESVRIGANCAISNCSLPANCVIPDNTFMHTAAANVKGETCFITITFNTKDDLKKSARKADALKTLSYFGTILKDVPNVGADSFPAEESEISLWAVKLFPAFSTMEESSRKACDDLSALSRTKETGWSQHVVKAATSCFSMRDVVMLKDVESMLKFRQTLLEETTSAFKHSHLSNGSTANKRQNT